MYDVKELYGWNEEVKKKALEVNDAIIMKKYSKEKELPTTHIFDEDLTVKENKQLVTLHNENVVKAKNYTVDLFHIKDNELDELMLAQLLEEYPCFNYKQVKHAFNEDRYEVNYGYWYSHVTDKLDFVKDMLELSGK